MNKTFLLISVLLGVGEIKAQNYDFPFQDPENPHAS